MGAAPVRWASRQGRVVLVVWVDGREERSGASGQAELWGVVEVDFGWGGAGAWRGGVL